MKVRSIETRHCGAGWRNYHFVKLTTEDGVVGWSEYDEHQGSIGVTQVVEKLAPLVVGQRVHDTERVYAILHARARQAMRFAANDRPHANILGLVEEGVSPLVTVSESIGTIKVRDQGRIREYTCSQHAVVLPMAKCDFIDFIVRPCVSIFSGYCNVRALVSHDIFTVTVTVSITKTVTVTVTVTVAITITVTVSVTNTVSYGYSYSYNCSCSYSFGYRCGSRFSFK